MAGDTGHTIIVERPLYLRVLGQRSGKKSCGVVTGFAMTREFNSLLVLNVFDVLLVERLAKSITVRGLPPLRVRVSVASAAALGRNEHFSGNKGTGGGAGIAGSKRVGTKFQILVLRNLRGVFRVGGA